MFRHIASFLGVLLYDSIELVDFDVRIKGLADRLVNNHRNISLHAPFGYSYTDKIFGHNIFNPFMVNVGLVGFVHMLTDFFCQKTFLALCLFSFSVTHHFVACFVALFKCFSAAVTFDLCCWVFVAVVCIRFTFAFEIAAVVDGGLLLLVMSLILMLSFPPLITDGNCNDNLEVQFFLFVV